MKEAPGRVTPPRTKCDEIAYKLYSLAKSDDNRAALLAIKEIIDRVDGKAAISSEEADAIKESGRVVMIDARMRPDRSEPMKMEPPLTLLAESSLVEDVEDLHEMQDSETDL